MSSDQVDQPLDPKLKAMFDNLRQVPPRDAEAASRGRANFMTEVDTMMNERPPVATSGFVERISKWVSSIRTRFGQQAVMASLAIIVVLIVIFGSAGMTALAAQSALPGDALYSVKTGLEDTRAGLTRDSSRQVEMYLQYARVRLDEIEQLIDNGRYDHINLAAEEFQQQIQNALRTLDRVSSGDPAKAIELATQITRDLSHYTQALSRMSTVVPAAVRPEIEKAIETSRNPGMVNVKSGGEVEIIGFIEKITPEGFIVDGQMVVVNSQTRAELNLAVGLMVKVQAMTGIDGVLTAKQVEAYQVLMGDDNLEMNSNGNHNMNSDDQHPGSLNVNEAQKSKDKEDKEGINAESGNTNSNRDRDKKQNEDDSEKKNKNSNEENENHNKNENEGGGSGSNENSHD